MDELKCKKCKRNFKFSKEQTYWDEKGYGCSTKLVNCPHCNCPNVVKISVDRWLRKLNNNGWEY